MCTPMRIAISAMIDGEDPGMPADRVNAHLASCAECRSWKESAESVTRAVRVQPVKVPDLTERVLAAVAADPVREAQGRRQVLRVALAVSALAQLLLGLPMLFAGSGEALHISREMASFDVAVAVGYLFAAWRPARAAALVPVAVALSACLLVTSTLDVINDGALLAHEIGHLLAVFQAGLLWALGRTATPPRTARTGGPIGTAA